MAMKPQLSLAKKKAAARARRPDKQKNAVDLAAVYERLTHRVGLLDKHEVTAVAGTSFKTIWEWMRASKFPRSRVVAGKSKWPAADIADWLDGLPVRALKGDQQNEAKECAA